MVVVVVVVVLQTEREKTTPEIKCNSCKQAQTSTSQGLVCITLCLFTSRELHFISSVTFSLSVLCLFFKYVFKAIMIESGFECFYTLLSARAAYKL